MSEQITIYGNELYHFGSKGMKWGKRRWQNEDGSLTEEGRIHYGYGPARAKYESLKGQEKIAYKKAEKAANDAVKGKNIRLKNIFTKEGRRKNVYANADNAKEYANSLNKWSNLSKKKYDAKQAYKKSSEYKQQVKNNVLKIGAAVAGTTLAAYGTYKVADFLKTKDINSYNDTGRHFLNSLKDVPVGDHRFNIYSHASDNAFRKAADLYDMNNFKYLAKKVLGK